MDGPPAGLPSYLIAREDVAVLLQWRQTAPRKLALASSIYALMKEDDGGADFTGTYVSCDPSVMQGAKPDSSDIGLMLGVVDGNSSDISFMRGQGRKAGDEL